MICEKCGVNIPKGAKKCPKCSAPVQDSFSCGGFCDILTVKEKIGSEGLRGPASGDSASAKKHYENTEMLMKYVRFNALISLIAAGLAFLILILTIIFGAVTLGKIGAAQESVDSIGGSSLISVFAGDETDGENKEEPKMPGSQTKIEKDNNQDPLNTKKPKGDVNIENEQAKSEAEEKAKAEAEEKAKAEAEEKAKAEAEEKAKAEAEKKAKAEAEEKAKAEAEEKAKAEAEEKAKAEAEEKAKAEAEEKAKAEAEEKAKSEAEEKAKAEAEEKAKAEAEEKAKAEEEEKAKAEEEKAKKEQEEKAKKEQLKK